jgi:hypothetical protein
MLLLWTVYPDAGDIDPFRQKLIRWGILGREYDPLSYSAGLPMG